MGRQRREEIEAGTDAALAPALGRVGDDLDDLIEVMAPCGAAIRKTGAYLTPLVRFTFDS